LGFVTLEDGAVVTSSSRRPLWICSYTTPVDANKAHSRRQKDDDFTAQDTEDLVDGASAFVREDYVGR
jgi:hypothetical protein